MKSDSIAIIPARRGSKRIPRKNIKLFCGVPMIQRTIMLLLSSNIFRGVYVTTDDPEISDISVKSGAMVPFERDRKLADDFTPTVPVIAGPPIVPIMAGRPIVPGMSGRPIVPSMAFCPVVPVMAGRPLAPAGRLRRSNISQKL